MNKELYVCLALSLSLSLYVCLSSYRETNRAFGNDAEQALEGLHPDFAIVWRRYLVRDETSEKYAQRVLDAVLTYCASHSPLLPL